MNKNLLFFFLFFHIDVFCQNENTNIPTQELTVVKSYIPSVSNKNKIRSKVSSSFLDLSSNSSITYELIQIPVLSTFKPNKASPLTLQRNSSRNSGFNNHVDFAFGNFNQFNFDSSNSFRFDKFQSLNIDFVSTNFGNIESSIVNSDQSLFLFGLNHLYSSNKHEAVHAFNVRNSKDNYYGIYTESDILTDPLLLDRVNTEQNRTEINFLSNWKFYNKLFKTISFDFNSNFDSFDSSEQFIKINGDILFSIFNSNFLVSPKYEFISSNFSQGYQNRNSIHSYYSKFDIFFQLSNLLDKFKYQIGARLNFITNVSNIPIPQVFLNPEILISYGDNGSKLQTYLSLTGGTDLNSYNKLSYLNPYLSPTLNLMPTQNLYDGKFGLKSSLSSRIELNFGVHFNSKKNTFLFKRNPYDNTVVNDGYRLANSFGLVYDDIDKYGIYSELNFRYNDENTFKFLFINYNYNLKEMMIPWNLPDFESSIILKMRIKEKFNLNFNGRLLGDRPSAYRSVFLNQNIDNSPSVLRNLSILTQIKTELNYRFADKLQTYLRMQFNFGKDMNQWDYYTINNNLLIAGIRYSFDLTF
ncbi:MAG: hypothetical protein CMC81_07625 [Flavobacteriaceae bacterium]|nr:hypothetical protein [Flavobacteriaceae bacterium]|tara:strand:+ start:676 stop:2421 length:1746 start_codon:yes stop_codon:yes gene_type:complete